MSVLLLRADSDSYQGMFPVDDLGWDRLSAFSGAPVGQSWVALNVLPYSGEGCARRLEVGDFPSLATHVPVFSEAALSVLGGELQRCGEVLPLDCPCGRYYAFNVTRILDVLDTARSDIRIFKATGRVQRIARYAFRDEDIGGEFIFKIPQVPLMDVFVTDRFVKLVKEAGLRGFLFLAVAE